MPFLLTAVLADGFYTDQILPCQQRLWSNITSIRQLGNNELKGLKFISRSILLQSELQYTKWGDWCSLSHISNKWRASPCPYTNIIIIERYRCWNTSTYAPQRWYLTINRVLTLISKTLYVFICAIVTQHWSWLVMDIQVLNWNVGIQPTGRRYHNQAKWFNDYFHEDEAPWT